MSKKYTFILVSAIFVFISYHSPSCLAGNKMNGPANLEARNQLETYGSGNNFLLNMYQNWISPVKGGNTCPMYPACSQYTKMSFQVLPWYEAYTISLERLLRCGNELDLYPVLRVNGQVHWYDPVIVRYSDRKLYKINHDK